MHKRQSSVLFLISYYSEFEPIFYSVGQTVIMSVGLYKLYGALLSAWCDSWKKRDHHYQCYS